MKKYDYIIVGSGLYGSLFAYRLKKMGKSVLVLERRPHIAGNIYTEKIEGINVHKYGAHIFHTSDKQVWDFVNNIIPFRPFVNSPIANYKGELYNLPFNMNTFYSLFGAKTPLEAKEAIKNETSKYADIEPQNLEEQALKLIGPTIYNKLIKGYTEKQWGRDAKDIPAFIIKRLPVRLNFDNNYFNDTWQGIPEGGYTALIEKLLDGIEVKLNVDYLKNKEDWNEKANRILFTGPIDEYFNFEYGNLDYRSLRFETEVLDTENYQGNPVVNYTDVKVPYTRILEHKHFLKDSSEKTVVTKEYSYEYKKGDEPYYPINDEKNNSLYERYFELSKKDNKIIFGGRLEEYKYYDMNVIVRKVLDLNII